MANHESFMASRKIKLNRKSKAWLCLFLNTWASKNLYKQRNIAGSFACSTIELCIWLTKILSAVKDRFQKYCETVYFSFSINPVSILKKMFTMLNLDYNPKLVLWKLLNFKRCIPTFPMWNWKNLKYSQKFFSTLTF